MESNKILIGIEFSDINNYTIGGFELMVLRDLSLNQLLDGIRIGLKLKCEDKSERENYERLNAIFTEYMNAYDSIIITSTNEGIDSGISISENGDEKLCDLGFITSTRILFSGSGQAKVYSLNDPEAITEAFKDKFPEYNISSRQLTVLDTEPVKIIPCPDPPNKPKLNILAMILPSMAMTLAMVMGRTLFMGGDIGISNGGMIGLALSMMVVNILVALFNFRRQMKEHQDKTAEWKEQYENYIKKTILKIEERQAADAIKMAADYPDTKILFDDTMRVSARIYSRVQNDNDFMTVRLGSSIDVETLFAIEGDKGDVIFAPTKYSWTAQNDGINIVLFPEKVKSKKEIGQKELYDKTEDYLVDLPHDISRKYSKMKCGKAPLLLRLRDCGTLGVYSAKDHLLNRLMNGIIFELCFYHSPQDLQFVMLYGASDEEEYILSPDNTSFHKYKFSPHFRELFNNRSQFVFDENNAKLMFDSLLSLIYERSEAAEDSKAVDFTQIVVIVYEEYGIKEHAIANFLPKAPKEGEPYQNNLGITFIFAKPFKELLPSFCGNIIEVKNKDELFLTPRSDSKQRKSFTNHVVKLGDDKITSGNRNISMLRDGDFYNRFKVLSAIYYTRIAQNAKVPSYVTLFKLLDIQKEITADNLSDEARKEAESKVFYDWLLNAWTSPERNDITKSLAVRIGMSENNPVALDLHEKEDGPHMLVAGTTGSGKSETIISYLIGLCLYYSPEEINLLLIDMKGGGFIKRLGHLPHVVGTVTDVDGDENGTGAEYMLKRFLESLASEVKRRKILFNQMGVDSIDGYIKKHRKLTKMKSAGNNEELNAELHELKLLEIPKSLSHLIFVVDEFTELKRASAGDGDMDFIAEITTIARVGRSLGFHIILISQNIEGAITDDIRVNSKARLCLKVATRQASKEMIGSDKAAAPDMPGNGRAYLLVGTGSRFEYFQSAYSGAESTQSLEMPFELKLAKTQGLYSTFFNSARDGIKHSENAETQLAFVVDQITNYCSFHQDDLVYPEYCAEHRKSLMRPHIIFNQPLPKQMIYDAEKSKVQSYLEQIKEWEELAVSSK